MKELRETTSLPYIKKSFRYTLYLLTTVCFLIDNDTVAAREAIILGTFLEENTGVVASHAISGDGSRVVFESSSDITGNNADGNPELFLWKMEGGFSQLTDTMGTTHFWQIDIDQNGSTVAVVADADITSSGATLTELYRWVEGGGWTRLTNTAGTFPFVFLGAIGINANGNRIMFSSMDDYVGANPKNETQVFLWELGGNITQITKASPCRTFGGNFGLDINDSGNKLLFSSRCKFGNWNPDLNSDIFIWDEATGIAPLTNEPEEVRASGSMSSDGTIAAFASSTDLVNGGMGSEHHLFRWAAGKGFEQLSVESVERFRPSISADGSRIAFTAKNGQGTSDNPEGAPELFLWKLGLGIVTLTDSEQTETSFGNQIPDLTDDGTRLSMVALRAFDAPHDHRSGYFVIDIMGLGVLSPIWLLLLSN